MNIWLVISPFAFWGKYWWCLEIIITLYHNTHNFYCFLSEIILCCSSHIFWYSKNMSGIKDFNISHFAWALLEYHLRRLLPRCHVPLKIWVKLITDHNKVNQMHINQDSFQVCCLSGLDQGGSVWPCIWWSWPSVAVLKSSLWFLWDQGWGFMAVNISFYDIKLKSGKGI